jgi:hypothetical protein
MENLVLVVLNPWVLLPVSLFFRFSNTETFGIHKIRHFVVSTVQSPILIHHVMHHNDNCTAHSHLKIKHLYSPKLPY